MKKLILVLVFLSSAMLSFAQDVIRKTNGEEIKCKIKSTDQSFVYYSIKVNGSDFNSTLLRGECS